MKKWLLIVFLSIGIISSCMTEVIDFEKDDDLTYTTGYLQVYLQNPVVTRSAWTYDNYFPNTDIFSFDSKEERLLHNLSIAYFDDDFLLEQFTTTVDRSGTYPYSSDIYDGYTAEDNKEYSVFTLGMSNLPLTTGAHYFYILCNLPKEYLAELSTYLNSNIKKLTKDEFEKRVLDYPVEGVTNIPYSEIGTTNTGQNYRFRRCLMTNITSPAPHYMADKSLIVGNGSYPAVNGISMDIGKSFAKVSLAYIPGNTSTGTLSNVQYRIANDPLRMYMLPNIFKGQVHTPHYEASANYTNFNDYFNAHFNPYSKVDKDDNDISDIADEANDFKWRNASEPNNTTSAYCMENGNQIPLQGNSTVVLVKAKYTPREWLNADGSPGAKSSDGTFWRIKNRAGQYLSGYYNEQPQVRSSQQAVRYQEGITYYPIWLQTEGKYMVERNHFYKIAITEVISAGAPDLTTIISPETKLENSSTETRSAAFSDSNIPEASNGIRWEQNN